MAQLTPLKRTSLTLTLLAAFATGATLDAAVAQGHTNSTVEWFDTLRDPTVLSSRASLGYDHTDQHQGAFRNKVSPSGSLAFGAEGQHDWMVSAELPFYHDYPGNSGGLRETGVGDLKIGVGHILDGTGRFRWGLGLATTFNTASEPQFGDGTFQLAPIWGAGYRFSPDFEWVANVQYNASATEANGRQPVKSLELKPALIKILPHHWYSLLGWDSTWDFDNGNLHRGTVKTEFGKGVGSRQQWVFYTGVDVPVMNAAQDNFTIRAGLNHIFN